MRGLVFWGTNRAFRHFSFELQLFDGISAGASVSIAENFQSSGQLRLTKIREDIKIALNILQEEDHGLQKVE